MSDPLDRIGGLASVRRLPDLLRARGKVTVIGAAGSGAALLAAWLAENVRTPTLIVCATGEEAEEFAEDVDLFRPALACHFPPLEVLPGDADEPSEVVLRARLHVLRHLAFGPDPDDGPPEADAYLAPTAATRVVAAAVNALMEPTSSADALREGSRTIRRGEAADPHALAAWLADHGYLALPQVAAPGQYALRGGILDVYSHGATRPVRIEFFGDEVESIRSFDPASQLSVDRAQSCLLAAAEHTGAGERPSASLLDHLPQDAAVYLVDPDRLRGRAQEVYDQAEQSGLLVPPPALWAAVEGRPRVEFRTDGEGADGDVVRVPMAQRDVFGPDLDSTFAELARVCRAHDAATVYCMSEAEARRLRALLQGRGPNGLDGLRFGIGRLNHGVLCAEAGLALIPHHRLFGRYRQRRFVPHAQEGRPVESVQDLSPGDLVVHVDHGIGRFLGTGVLEQGGRTREYLEIEFAEQVHVHVPCDRIELVHRYIGVGGRRPELSHIRSAGWWRAKERAREAIEDMAAELLEVQALRETQQGIAAPDDTEWQQQFESEFPYEETEDQLRAAEEVRRDMCSPQPMDRLICGDVGYGKTEIAMRAAFRCVMGGRQAAMLVPTTVLAQQHFRTFSERMADYPVRVEMLSRFLTDAETRRVLAGLAEGTVDVVIGTHRLVQSSVRIKNLGLVIIDEEQRFGVEHKESLKKLRRTVDVLTLSATPIPRTLHMALMGLREISALQTPPHDRQAIETRVSRFSPQILRHAVLRELNRQGQVFVIHNRVHSITDFADRVRSIVPEATVAVAHGRMPENELAGTMDDFIDGRIDVLVSTTIVESGLDIPNANTIVLNRSDLLGLAEMHQLRGRVGRYIHKAYAYFFVPESRPVTPEAQSRLDAIRRYSHLGAGFDIALRDLEMRGAGNILGPAQSGHIAAVGYNLYCRLLAQAVRGLKGRPPEEPPDVTVELGLDAYLPDDYVPTPRQKMEIYRRLHRATGLAGIQEVRAALRDRFGPPPRPAENLLLQAELRVLAARAGLAAVHVRDGRIHLSVRDEAAMERWFATAPARPRRIAEDLAVIDHGFPADSPEATAAFLRKLLGRAPARVP
ncbi:MAG: transcription-repair coupling factor [Candidatus Brocadiaceae bacterium]|nr:transcription-repair coupling factor [Candidatus Brocadiaceae bacterium]